MNRRPTWFVALIALVVVGTGAAVFLSSTAERKPPSVGQRRWFLFNEIQPVKLSNCQLERFGETHDGGYLLCANLLTEVQAGYSYGISGYDRWGCDVTQRLRVPVHQYDCFNLTRPACTAGTTIFHEECVDGTTRIDESGRLFDTILSQLRSNGDRGKRIVMKMDVEGSEWVTLLKAPDALLRDIDQLAIEFHGIDDDLFREVIQRLKRFFYVVHLHYNNHACRNAAPFPADVYEMLFVSKRIGVLDRGTKPERPHPLDRRNNPAIRDCQVPPPVLPSASHRR
jgi:hypothetical protein